MRLMYFRGFLALALMFVATSATAQDRYFGVVVGSQHIGSDAYNDFNPGLTFGRRHELGAGPAEWHWEGGVFYNSYREVSPILVAGMSTRLLQTPAGDLRVGASVGTAYYGVLSDFLKNRYGIPNVGGFIPIGILTASWRSDHMETRLNVIPYGDDVDGVVNLSFAVPF